MTENVSDAPGEGQLEPQRNQMKCGTKRNDFFVIVVVMLMFLHSGAVWCFASTRAYFPDYLNNPGDTCMSQQYYRLVMTNYPEQTGTNTTYFWVIGSDNVDGNPCTLIYDSDTGYYQDHSSQEIKYGSYCKNRVGSDLRVYEVEVIYSNGTIDQTIYHPYQNNFTELAQDAVYTSSYSFDGAGGHSDIEIQTRLLGYEPVSTRYGSYADCLKIQDTMIIQTTSAYGYTSNSKSDVTKWYAKNVGLVKTYSQQQDTTSTSEFNWSCTGTNSNIGDTTPVNGQCGSADGTAFNSAPLTNLCGVGTPSSVSGIGPWWWSCQGDNGGTTANCSAEKTPAYSPLSLTLSGTGSGTITSSPTGINCGTACSTSYDTNTQVTLTATPASGSYFSGFSTPCAGSSSCTFTLTANTQISATFDLQSPDYYDTVQKCYIGYYQRPADPVGLLWWAERLKEANGNLNAIIEAFAKSDESKALYGEVNNDTISVVVDGIYMGLLSRAASKEENDYWSGLFKEGRISSAAIMLIMLNGAQNEDLTTINNKLTAANLFTKTIDPELDGAALQATYAGNNDAEKARGFLTSVTTNAGSVPDQDAVTDYIRTYIADQGDGIVK